MRIKKALVAALIDAWIDADGERYDEGSHGIKNRPTGPAPECPPSGVPVS
jgi:hypothetical protein